MMYVGMNCPKCMGALIIGEEGIYYCENCSKKEIQKIEIVSNSKS